MDMNFRIDIDPATDLVTVTLSGFMEAAAVEAFRLRLREALGSLNCGQGRHLALYDIRTCKIQSQQVVGMFRSMSDAKHVAARRIAIVVGDSLMRMQLPRIVVGRDLRTFDEVGPAIAWLKSADVDTQATGGRRMASV